MQASLKYWSSLSLLIALVLGVPSLLPAQAPQKTPAQRTQNSSIGQTSQEIRRAPAKAEPAEERNLDEAEPETAAALQRLHRDIERQVINRMRYGQPDRFQSFSNEIAPIFVFLVITTALLWILRVVLDNRRWYRVVRVQTDMHTKLLEKFGSSQDMLAYMESDAGKRFLESPAFDIQPKQSVGIPYARILWSAQVGLVMATVGFGLLMLRGHVPVESFDSVTGVMRTTNDADSPLLVFGTIVLTLGIGFLLSAVVSFVLSKRFGLLERPSAPGAGTISAAS
jgi:hypothetical protein